MVLVSVIVPIYNVEKYLRECINSIIGQTYAALQIILVDDGSPDGCGAICDEYAAKDERIEVLHCVNGGLSAARNRGLKRCKGKYVFFVDSDDWLEENAVQVLVRKSEEEKLDILLYDAISFDEESPYEQDEENHKYIREHDYHQVQSGADMFLAMVKNDEYRSPVQYYFYLRSFLSEQRLTFHEGIIHEDEEFSFFALLQAQRTSHMKDVLYHHRFRRDSIMGARVSRKNVDCLNEVILTAIDRSGSFLASDETREAFQVGFCRLVSCYFNFLKLSGDGETEETKNQIRQLRKCVKQHRYFQDRRIRRKVCHPYGKRITVKAIKMRVYPLLAPLLHKLGLRK